MIYLYIYVQNYTCLRYFYLDDDFYLICCNFDISLFFFFFFFFLLSGYHPLTFLILVLFDISSDVTQLENGN